MFKNTASQKVRYFAFDYSTGAPKTGDAANHTVYIDKDFAGFNALTDTTSAEVSSANQPGWYEADVSQTESNCDQYQFAGKSSTSNIVLVFGGLKHTLPTTGLLAPTTAGRTLDVSAGGEAGIDWANIGSPTTTVGLSGTTVKTATDVETDTQDIQGRIPAALSSGNMKCDALAINGVATTSVTTINANLGTTQPVNFTGTGASALAKSDMVDIAGAAVSTSSAQIGVNVVNAAGTAWGSGAITAAAIADGAIDAATFAADVDAEILSYLVDDATRIDASSLNTATVTTIPAILVDTGTTLDANITAILADTNELQTNQGNWLTATSVTVSDKTGFSLSTAGIQALIELCFTYDATADYSGADAGSLVKQIADNAGSGGGSDPWDTALPGSYTSGKAGYILGTYLDAAISGVGGAVGAGADACTLNLKVGGNNVADADVWISSDADGDVIVAGTLQTDSNGNATFQLDAGNTYYFWAQKDGYNLPQGELFTAVAD